VSDIPKVVTNSGLWARLSISTDLRQVLEHLRNTAEAIGAKTAETIPEFTDHSVVHMDALWTICDQIFTIGEIERFTASEAFVLGTSFYLHDLGMALGATLEGRTLLEQSPDYEATVRRLQETPGLSESDATLIALKVVARNRHAENAELIAQQPLPGIDQCLIEPNHIRRDWSDYIGKIAASHHWSLLRVDAELGSRGRVPDPLGTTIDLGYIACALRLIDYAHINAKRASPLDRALRSRISDDSIAHWYAQESISGPVREGDLLVYGSMRPVRDVDAWWIFYEMAAGLDREITAVTEYLEARAVSMGRFSLEGVKGVRSPHAFASLIKPQGFEPVDVRFRPDSMSRLVDLLGGRTLYGNDQFAPIRELLQNGADAIHLRRATEIGSRLEPTIGEIDVTLQFRDGVGTLSVADNGIGMSEKVITRYLLGIASDYWRSNDYSGEYPLASQHGFRPAGRFGIGFLSVFMFGPDVVVESQRANGSNLTLRLRGTGRRGALDLRPSTLRVGTGVTVSLEPDRLGDFEGLARIVQAKAPMLDIRVKVNEQGALAAVEPKWWQRASQEELSEFLAHRVAVATVPQRLRKSRAQQRYSPMETVLRSVPEFSKWPGDQPEVVSDTCRVIANPDASHVVLCSRGFAVSSVAMSGMFGLVEVGDIELNAARSAPLGFDSERFRTNLLAQLRPRILESTDRLALDGMIPSRFAFLRMLADVYGVDLLLETSAPWIPLVESPGNMILLSSAQLQSRLQNSQELLLTYDASPWDADRIARHRYPVAVKNALVIPVPRASGPRVGSYREEREEAIEGSLAEHFISEHGDGGLDDAALLLAVIYAIADAWGKSEDQLKADRWIRQERVLSAHIRRG
jgi:hypothetical protein